jgi:hypothetical protein
MDVARGTNTVAKMNVGNGVREASNRERAGRIV